MTSKEGNLRTRPDLIDPDLLDGLGLVLAFGATKYSDNGWKNKEFHSEHSKVNASLERHHVQARQGQLFDEESGLPVIHHEICNLMFKAHYLKREGKYTKKPEPVVPKSEKPSFPSITMYSNTEQIDQDGDLGTLTDRPRLASTPSSASVSGVEAPFKVPKLSEIEPCIPVKKVFPSGKFFRTAHTTTITTQPGFVPDDIDVTKLAGSDQWKNKKGKPRLNTNAYDHVYD